MSGLVAFIAGPYRLLGGHWRLLGRTTASEVRGTYAGSIIGAAWLLIGPAILLGLYALVYTVIFRVRPVGLTVTEYVLYVCSGLVAFITFGATLPAGASSLAANRHLLLNTVFPAELIPVRSVLVATATLPAGLVLLLAADVALAHATWTWVLVPAVAVLQTLFVIGAAWVLSLAVLLVRDVQQIIGYVVMLLLIVTPIAYTPDMVPAQLRWITLCNPLAYFVTAYQSLIVLDRPPPASVALGMVAFTLASMALGHAAARAARRSFYDLA